jgi:hypothetical protein
MNLKSSKSSLFGDGGQEEMGNSKKDENKRTLFKMINYSKGNIALERK